MARKTIEQLTGLFADGETPPGSDFASIFDSNLNLQETGTSVASGSLTVLSNATLKGNVTLGTNGAGSTHTIYGNITHWDNFTTYGILTANGNTVLGNAASDTVTITGNVTASGYTVSASAFIGDGSGLSNLPASSPFPLSGSAIISSSYTPGDSNSHVLQLIGSGSVSGSGLFEIQGSSTTLFSVTDDMTGELFAANDASGLSIISANADRTVKLGKPGGFGIVISGSNPMPADAAARIEITGSTYFSGNISDFSGVSEIKALQRPITTLAANVTASATNAGYYFVVGGNQVCSIQSSSLVSAPIGVEYEFFQTSSAGNFTFTAGTGVTFMSKDSNTKLAGQYSAASLKKIAAETWTLVGDLTT